MAWRVCCPFAHDVERSLLRWLSREPFSVAFLVSTEPLKIHENTIVDRLLWRLIPPNLLVIMTTNIYNNNDNNDNNDNNGNNDNNDNNNNLYNNLYNNNNLIYDIAHVCHCSHCKAFRRWAQHERQAVDCATGQGHWLLGPGHVQSWALVFVKIILASYSGLLLINSIVIINYHH